MALIIAPTAHNEFMCGIQFINGQAESGKASTLNYFRTIGYETQRNISDPPDPDDVIDNHTYAERAALEALLEPDGQPDDLSTLGQSQED